jgi:Arc/MetJ-type ribon-helix-helix transcriptional regulator
MKNKIQVDDHVSVSTALTPGISKMIDKLVEKGIYNSRDEFVRQCCKEGLIEYMKHDIIPKGLANCLTIK